MNDVPTDPFADFGATVERFQNVLLNFFMRKGVSYCDAQDLTQQTFVRLWKYRDRYEPTAKFTTFLFLVAGQVALDFFRAEGRKRKLEEGFEQACENGTVVLSGAETAASDGADGRDVREAVAKLDPLYRDVVELGVFQDLPYAEVAEILGIPQGTVKSRMFNALKKLKEMLVK